MREREGPDLAEWLVLEMEEKVTNPAITPLAQRVADHLAQAIARICAKNGIKAQAPRELATPVGTDGYEHVVNVPVLFHGKSRATENLAWTGDSDEDGMALECMGDDAVTELAEEMVRTVRLRTYSPSFAAMYLPQAVDHAALGRSENIIVRIVRVFDVISARHRTRVDCLYKAG